MKLIEAATVVIFTLQCLGGVAEVVQWLW